MAILDEYNAPIVWNFDKTFADGHFNLEELEVRPLPDGKYLTVCRPLDVRLGKGILFPRGFQELQKKFEKLCEEGTRIEIAGAIHRQIIWYLPDDPTNIPEAIKNIDFGMFLAIMIEAKRQGFLIRDMLKTRKLTESELMEGMASGEINDWFMQKFQQQFKSFGEIIAKQTVEKTLAEQKKLPDNSESDRQK